MRGSVKPPAVLAGAGFRRRVTPRRSAEACRARRRGRAAGHRRGVARAEPGDRQRHQDTDQQKLQQEAERTGHAAETVAEQHAEQAADEDAAHQRAAHAVEQAGALLANRLLLASCRVWRGRHGALDRAGLGGRGAGRRRGLLRAQAPAAETAAAPCLGEVDGDERQRHEGGRKESEKSKASRTHHGNRVLQSPAPDNHKAGRCHAVRHHDPLRDRQRGPVRAANVVRPTGRVAREIRTAPIRAARRRSAS